MQRSRNYVFTYNNYTVADENRIRSLPSRYLVYGREVAPTTATRHLQGFISFPNARGLAPVRRLLGCHVEVARGTPAQCRTYCIKDGDFVETGEIPADPGEREADRWALALEAAKEGRVEDIPPDIFLRHYSTIRRIERDFENAPSILENTAGIWIHGVAGCGKTRAVYDRYPGLYPKGLNKWWCAYKKEEVVLIDDVDKSHGQWIGYFLKIWGDRYGFIGESKGGSFKIRPPKVIVTSQYKIEDIFADIETRAALLRRFIVIEKFIGQNIII